MEIYICVRSINPWGCKKAPLLPPLLISGYSVVTSLPETASEHAAGIILHIFSDFRGKIRKPVLKHKKNLDLNFC